MPPSANIPLIRIGLVLALGASMLLASPALAEPFRCPVETAEERKEDEGRRLFGEALRLEPGDPEASLVRLNCIEQLVQRAAVVLRIGMISERLGRYDHAIAAFERYLERAGETAPDRAEIEQRIAKLRRKSSSAGEVPGTPRLADDPRPRLAGIIVGALGGAMALSGGALLIAAKGHSDEVRDIEGGTTRWDSDEAGGLHDQALLEQGIGVAFLIGGGALLVGGLSIALWPPDDTAEAEPSEAGPEPRVSLQLAPAGVALRVSY